MPGFRGGLVLVENHLGGGINKEEKRKKKRKEEKKRPTSAALAAALIASPLSLSLSLSHSRSLSRSRSLRSGPPALIFGTGAVGAEPSVRPGREKGSEVGFEGGEVDVEGLLQRVPIFVSCGRV